MQNTDRVILHSDFNSFYASVELLHRPELRGHPMAVGGDPEARHGIVLAKDQLAKKAGVQTGMALWEARQKCPEITFVPPNMRLYMRFSKLAREIYSQFSDQIESFGLDENWIDVTHSTKAFGSGLEIAEKISSQIKYELGITVSIGVSWNKIFAKLGSDYKKPDAITEINKDNYKDIAWNLPVGDLLYVGKATKRKLYKMGILTIGQLAQNDPIYLKAALGKMGLVLHLFANGLDQSPVEKEDFHVPIKSIGNSVTTPRDLLTDEDVKITIFVLAESVAARLRENNFRCSVVEISLRDTDLYCFTRQKKLQSSSDITIEIAEAAYGLFKQAYNFKKQKPLRSVGVRGCNLVPNILAEQINLFMDPIRKEKLRKLDRAVDDLRERFGNYSIQRGILLKDRGLSTVNAKEEHTIHPKGYFQNGNKVGVDIFNI